LALPQPMVSLLLGREDSTLRLAEPHTAALCFFCDNPASHDPPAPQRPLKELLRGGESEIDRITFTKVGMVFFNSSRRRFSS
jgi:hypothetical protein